ncbi:hypothetical protein KJ564_01025, partial [bacterium]|nr:hypothetical protein [bacterium]
MKRTYLLIILAALLLVCAQISHSYWPVTTDHDLPIANEIHTNYFYYSSEPFTDGSVLLLYAGTPTPTTSYQIIDRYGEFQFSEPQDIFPGLLENGSIPKLLMDEVGGAWFVTEIGNTGTTPNEGIFVQRIDSLGNRLWGDTGIQAFPHDGSNRVCLDGMGGIIIGCWYDPWEPYAVDKVFAQRVDGEGNVLWGEEGIEVSPVTQYIEQRQARVASDGGGGAFIIWEDGRASVEADLYANRLDADGNVCWQPDLVLFTGGPYCHELIPDQAGGMIVETTADNDMDHYRVDRDGNILWHIEGLSHFGDFQRHDMLPGDQTYFYLGSPFTDQRYWGQKVDFNGTTYWPGEHGAMFNLNTQNWYITNNAGFYYSGGNFYSSFIQRSDLGWPPQEVRLSVSMLDSSGNRLLGDEGVVARRVYNGYGFQDYPLVTPLADGGIFTMYKMGWGEEVFRYHLYGKRVSPNGTLGGPLHLLVDLEPESASIQIPPTGGSFTYNIAIEDTYVVYSDFDAWVEVTMPGGDTREITLRENVLIDANSTLERVNLVQN